MTISTSIAIVDDSALWLEIAEAMAVESGLFHEIHTFSNPKKALAYLLDGPVDVLMSEIEMLNMNGFELMDRTPRNTIKVGTTTMEDHIPRTQSIGCQEFLLKPFDKDRFHKALRRASVLSLICRGENVPAYLEKRHLLN